MLNIMQINLNFQIWFEKDAKSMLINTDGIKLKGFHNSYF